MYDSANPIGEMAIVMEAELPEALKVASVDMLWSVLGEDQEAKEEAASRIAPLATDDFLRAFEGTEVYALIIRSDTYVRIH